MLQQCAFCTFFNMWVNVKGLIAGGDAAVPVELLTDGQRGVHFACPRIRMIAHCQVLESDILKKMYEEGYLDI